MKPNRRFIGKSKRFWANAKFISERVGYSKKRSGVLRTYTKAEAHKVLSEHKANVPPALLDEIVAYLNWRANRLNNQISKRFMNRVEARKEYRSMRKRLGSKRHIVMSKRKGKQKHPAYLTNIVGMLAENVLGKSGFIDDTQRLSVVTSNGIIEEIFSRRFDGAVPDTRNPRAVWEIKEYYDNKSFGSRVADGVYETLLDGYEIQGVQSRIGHRIKHFLFIDDRHTWWDIGKSYLCRMVDMLHTGHVDEIFFGREVLSDWEPRLRALKK